MHPFFDIHSHPPEMFIFRCTPSLSSSVLWWWAHLFFGNFKPLITSEIRCAICLCTKMYSVFAKIMERIVHNMCMNDWRNWIWWICLYYLIWKWVSELHFCCFNQYCNCEMWNIRLDILTSTSSLWHHLSI